VPFGEHAWTQAQQILARRGEDPGTQAQIAGAVTALLDRAEQGPGRAHKTDHTTRDRRVAARTRATTEPNWPRAVDDLTPDDTADDDVAADPATGDQADAGPAASTTPRDPATVIPLAIFDAREEAKRWW